MMSDKLKGVAKRLLYPVPSCLAQKHIHIDDDRLDTIREAIKRDYHTGWRSEGNYSEALYQTDLAAHLHKRLEGDRMRTIPWINSARPLDLQRAAPRIRLSSDCSESLSIERHR